MEYKNGLVNGLFIGIDYSKHIMNVFKDIHLMLKHYGFKIKTKYIKNKDCIYTQRIIKSSINIINTINRDGINNIGKFILTNNLILKDNVYILCSDNKYIIVINTPNGIEVTYFLDELQLKDIKEGTKKSDDILQENKLMEFAIPLNVAYKSTLNTNINSFVDDLLEILNKNDIIVDIVIKIKVKSKDLVNLIK